MQIMDDYFLPKYVGICFRSDFVFVHYIPYSFGINNNLRLRTSIYTIR